MTASDPAPNTIVRRIYRNLGLLISGKGAAGLFSLAYMVLAARALGPADYGVLILVHTYTVTVGGIVSFPGWHAVVRYGAEAIAADDRPRMFRLLRFTALLELAAGALAIAITMLFAGWAGRRLGWSQTAIDFALPYSFAVLAAVRSTPAGLLQLLGRFAWLGAHHAIAPAVRLLGAGVAIAFGAGLKGFLIVWLAAAIVECLSLWVLGWLALRAHGSDGFWRHSRRGVRRENPGLWRFLLAANADVTFAELGARLAPLTVGWVLGPAAAGLYALAQRATVILVQPAQILGQAAFAELARLTAAGTAAHRMRRTLLRTLRIALLLAVPVFASMTLFAEPLSRALGGPAFAAAAGILVWLAAARWLLIAAPPISAALTALGQPLASLRANLAGGLLLWPLLPPLLWHWQLTGAGVHALLQALLIATLLLRFVVRATRSR